MMLLRNRYFKGCAFNTKIQQWFKDNDITSIDQLNGVTLANDISEVRMIVTESCLKFCKMLDSETDDFESIAVGKMLAVAGGFQHRHGKAHHHDAGDQDGQPALQVFRAVEALREADRKSTRLNSSHTDSSRMPSSA